MNIFSFFYWVFFCFIKPWLWLTTCLPLWTSVWTGSCPYAFVEHCCPHSGLGDANGWYSALDDWRNFLHVRHISQCIAQQKHESQADCSNVTERRTMLPCRYLETGTIVLFPSSSSSFFHQQTFQMAFCWGSIANTDRKMWNCLFHVDNDRAHFLSPRLAFAFDCKWLAVVSLFPSQFSHHLTRLQSFSFRELRLYSKCRHTMLLSRLVCYCLCHRHLTLLSCLAAL